MQDIFQFFNELIFLKIHHLVIQILHQILNGIRKDKLKNISLLDSW